MTRVKNSHSSKFESGSKLRLGLRLSVCLLLGSITAPLAAAKLDVHRVESLDYGRALFHFFQDRELAAITHLMIAAERPRTQSQLNESNLLLADLYYGYGLYEESRGLFAELLSTEVSAAIQNRIWFNLARLRFEQGHYDHARDLLSRINGQLPANIESERKYLLTNLYLGNRQYDQATAVSNQIDPQSIWKVYARYNLAVSMIENDQFERGRFLLDQLGQMRATSEEIVALRDRANLSLGIKQLRMELPESALKSLSRIRLEGPLSHEALLASGWAWYRLDNFDKAMLAWQILLRRNAVDPATQEAILAIPSNYAKAGRDRQAIHYYEVAAKQFDTQLALLDDAIDAINQNGLIGALRKHAILFDRNSLQRFPPSSEVTSQLHLFLASREFQRVVKRYQQLLDIRQSLRYWDFNFPALKLMLDERRQTFRQKLPTLHRSTNFDRLEQLSAERNRYAAALKSIAAKEDYQALASPAQQDHLQRLQRVADLLDRIGTSQDVSEERAKYRLFSGLLHYQLATDFPARYWQAKKQLEGLDKALVEATVRVGGLLRISDRTELEFNLFDHRISGQVERIQGLHRRVTALMNKQEQRINQLAIDAIRRQQQHIVQLRLNARFELAKLYDKLAVEDG